MPLNLLVRSYKLGISIQPSVAPGLNQKDKASWFIKNEGDDARG